MGLEAVLEEIRERGRKEVERIRRESQEETTRVLTAAQERAAKIKQTANEEVERQAAYIMGQEVSAANLQVKRELLNTQKELLDQVYQRAKEAIAGLPESFHREAIINLLREAKTQIQGGVVHVNPAIGDYSKKSSRRTPSSGIFLWEAATPTSMVV